MLSIKIVLTAVCLAPALAQTNSFLGKDLLPDLLQELDTAIGRDHRDATEKRASRLEAAMRPMFDSLPKNSAGNLDATGVRYMLRRLFVQRHAWKVRGLESDVEDNGTSTPGSAIDEYFGLSVDDVFSKRLERKGFSLHQAAVLAALLENLIHGEGSQRLAVAYAHLGYSTAAHLSKEKITIAMRTYMLQYMFGLNSSAVTGAELLKHAQNAKRWMPFWTRSREFMAESWDAVLDEDDEARASPTSYDTVLKAIDRVNEGYGKWQHTECGKVKEKLMDLEIGSSGRVHLDSFYASKAYNGTWYFSESVPYLRSLGALDESDPARLKVIIPNYINGPNTCSYPSKFYSVCCIDECDALLSHVEEQVRAPTSPPQRILDIVAALPSDTIKAPRVLPDLLVQRLRQIAEQSGGAIHLHSRLFAQWLHHAYPRECNYPHVAGTITPMTGDEFDERFGEYAHGYSRSEMIEVIKELRQKHGASDTLPADDFDLPWSHEDEHFASKQESSRAWTWMWKAIKWLLMAAPFYLFLAFERPLSHIVGAGDKSRKVHSPDHKVFV